MPIEIKLWVLLAFVPVVWWIVRWGINRIVSKLDEIIAQNAKFQNELVRQNGEITNLKDKSTSHETRLNDHSKRIREIEMKQSNMCYKSEDKCK